MPDNIRGRDRPWRDEETIRELYVEKKLSTTEIGERLNCDSKTVSRWLEKHGIEARGRVEAMTRVKRKEPVRYRTHPRGYEHWRCQIDGTKRTVYVHRLVAVAEWGFDAVADKHVHHKNEVPWDNRPENLELLAPGDHHRHHLQDREWDDQGNLI